MKKAMIYTVTLLLVTLITVSGTYAFFSAMTTNNNTIAGTHQIKVIYSGDTQIEGYIDLVKAKEEGFRRVVSIALGEDSVPAEANIYIYLEQLDEGLATNALKWEIYELNDETETYVNSGTFYGYTSTNKVYMLEGLSLPKETKEYAVYLWLNGYEAGNEVRGATLRGYIGAETNTITGLTS